MPSFKKTLFLAFILFIGNVTAHKNFWEIKATALPDEDTLSFSILLSLDQVNEFYKEKLGISEYKATDKDKLTEKIVALAPDILTIKSSNNLITPFVKNVELIIDESLAQEKTLSLISVDVNIELVYSLDGPKIEGTWNLYADSLVKKKVKDLSQIPPKALDVNLYFLDERLTKISVNSNMKNFSWENNASIPSKPLELISKHKTVKENPSYLSISLLLIAIGVWAFSTSKVSQLTSYTFLLCAIVSYTTPTFSSTKTTINHTLPNEAKLIIFLDTAIKKIYSSVSAKDKNRKWNSISDLVTDKFNKQLFLANHIEENKSISHFVESIEISSVKILSNSKAECKWKANALFQHIFHIHEKSMSFKGTFQFDQKGNEWLISEVNVRRLL